jgi:hypothetical protein
MEQEGNIAKVVTARGKKKENAKNVRETGKLNALNVKAQERLKARGKQNENNNKIVDCRIFLLFPAWIYIGFGRNTSL